MPLQTKVFGQIVNDLVSKWAGELQLSPSLVSGDPLLAIMQSVASQQLFLQALCEAVLKFARASTAEGEDLDSWLADFNFKRLPAIKAKGQVQFGLKIAKSTNTLIPLNKVIQVSGGAIQYKVVKDTSQTAWNEEQQGYVIVAGDSYATVTVESLTPGYAYNVQPGQLNEIASTITGVDTVFNVVAITNGLNAESDADCRNRFILYINSLSRNTRPAISAAIMSVQQGINFNLVENVDQNGDPRDGWFTVVIDDGSGDPPDSLLLKIQEAIEPVRGFTIGSNVVAATKVLVTAALNIRVKAGANAVQTQMNVQNKLVLYINQLLIGESLKVYKLIQIAFEADPNVIDVQVNSALVNGSEANLVPTIFEVIRTVPANVSVGLAS